eukprot:241296_1
MRSSVNKVFVSKMKTVWCILLLLAISAGCIACSTSNDSIHSGSKRKNDDFVESTQPQKRRRVTNVNKDAPQTPLDFSGLGDLQFSNQDDQNTGITTPGNNWGSLRPNQNQNNIQQRTRTVKNNQDQKTHHLRTPDQITSFLKQLHHHQDIIHNNSNNIRSNANNRNKHRYRLVPSIPVDHPTITRIRQTTPVMQHPRNVQPIYPLSMQHPNTNYVRQPPNNYQARHPNTLQSAAHGTFNPSQPYWVNLGSDQKSGQYPVPQPPYGRTIWQEADGYANTSRTIQPPTVIPQINIVNHNHYHQRNTPSPPFPKFPYIPNLGTPWTSNPNHAPTPPTPANVSMQSVQVRDDKLEELIKQYKQNKAAKNSNSGGGKKK